MLLYALTTAIKAAERGAYEYLPKPFDLKELVAVVGRALKAPKNGKGTPQRPPEAEERVYVAGGAERQQQ